MKRAPSGGDGWRADTRRPDPISSALALGEPEAAAQAMRRLRATCHPACIGCRPRGEGGLGLQFFYADHGVRARFDSDPSYQGYPDRLHGGIIATLLDAAMTHCLFGRGVLAYTVKMEIRFRQPVVVGTQALVRAEVIRSRPPWYRLRAEVIQHGEIQASAEAVFHGRSSTALEEVEPNR